MDGIVIDRKDGIVRITLDRPEKRNAIDGSMFDALCEEFNSVAKNDDDRVVVLAGSGGAFSSGGDLAPSAPSGEDTMTMMRRISRAASALHECPKPVIASVDGVAVGAGVSLVLGCDLVVASDRARFSLMFVRNGLGLDMGASWLLPRRLGWCRAAELALLGDWIDAATAQSIGLVNRVVGVDDLAALSEEWAMRIASYSPRAVPSIQRSLADASRLTRAEAREVEAQVQTECAASPELRAAIEARRR
ncbi:MAG: enoyl-CoA hydratase/isomerase family protein [Acidimicrobiia bacterium]